MEYNTREKKVGKLEQTAIIRKLWKDDSFYLYNVCAK
jgi:hypothetical protein